MRKFTKISMLLIFCLSAAVVWSQTSTMSHTYLAKEKAQKIIKYDPVNVPPTDQGGEDIATAVAITAPYTNTGSTVAYLDDYEEVCPYASTSPDVVYSYTPVVDEALDIDLLGSAYDTKLFVYEDLATPGAPYACNDDYHPDYTSALFGLAVYTGHTYYIVIDGYGGASGTYSIALAAGSLIPPPPNDECTAVTPTTLIDGVPVVFTGDNTGATESCPGYLLAYGEAWEAFTLTGTADVTLDYCGSGGGTVWGNAYVNVLTSCPCGPISAAAAYDFLTCADGNVTMTWTGFPAGTYYYPVMLDASNNSIGPYTINVVATYSTAPPNYTCADAIAVTPGTYTAPGPATGGGAANICYSGATNAVWYSFTPAADGLVTIESTTTGGDTRLSFYDGPCATLNCVASDDDGGTGYLSLLSDVPVTGGTTYYIEWDDYWSSAGFDWYLDFSVPGSTCDDAVTVIEGTHTCPGPVVGLGGAALNCFTTGATDAYWYEYTPAADGLVTIESTTTGGDTRLSFYDGTCAVLNCVASDDDGGTGYLSLISNVPVTSGTTYYIEWDDRWETAGFDWYLTFTGGGLPTGSVCDDPLVISALPYTTSDNTSNYGDDYSSADEICSSSSYLNGDDVVYSYTPAADECVDITLTNTGTYVGLFVYEGCAPFTTCMGSNTQSGGNPSLTGVNLIGGTTYYIVISTWPSPQSTAYDLNIDACAGPMPGDDCTNPIYAIQGLNNAPQQPVWYEYTTTGSGHLEISSRGAGVDTRLYVYSDCSGTLKADNDDFWGYPPGESWVRFSVSPGETYHILWGDNYSTAPFTFSLIETSTATSWTGGVDNDWWNTGNWSSGIPGYYTSVTVPAGLLNNPTVGHYAVCHDIFLGSDASGTATLVDDSYLLVNGTATVQRYYATGDPTMEEWHLISAPITNAQSIIYTGLYLQWFDEANVLWNDIIPNTAYLTSLQGFAFYAPNNGMTFNYAGALGNGPYGINISAVGTHPDGYHWNLFGNPYPSSLDWDAVAAVNGSAGTGNLALDAVYYLDQATANYEYYVGGIGSPNVPPGQGFMVAGANDGSTFTVDNSMRTHSGSGTYYKSEFDNLLVLEAAGSDYSDVAYLRFDDGATEDVDRQFDAVKLFTDSNPYLPQLYTVGGNKLAINVLPETAMVPAGFKAGVPGIYTINIKEVTGMANVVLEDLVMETQTDLLENEYTFNYDLNDPEGRFIIHFTPLAVGENLAELVNIYSYNKDVYVKVPENTKGNIVVFNTMGQEVARTNITDALNIISLEKGAYYVVKVMSNESVVTKKVFVK